MGQYGPEFYETRMGAEFYEGTMPQIAESLQDIAKSLDKIANKSADDDGMITVRFPEDEADDFIGQITDVFGSSLSDAANSSGSNLPEGPDYDQMMDSVVEKLKDLLHAYTVKKGE